MTEIEKLNKWLENEGKSPDNKIIYRLVWSNKIFEHRFGLFHDFTESGLFIREIRETRLVRKYNYINERWILEKWAPGNLTANKETPNSLTGDYIPIYVFETSKGEYLAPNERSLKFILDFMRGRIRKDEEPPPEFLEKEEINNQIDTLLDHPSFKTSGPTRDSVAYAKGLKDVSVFNRD